MLLTPTLMYTLNNTTKKRARGSPKATEVISKTENSVTLNEQAEWVCSKVRGVPTEQDFS